MKRLIGKATVIAISMFLSLSITSVASGFEKWDGLAAGDVVGDGKAEIIHGDRSSDRIQIFDMKGMLLTSFPLNFEEKDGLAVGDVDGVGKAEIIHADRANWIRIYDMEGELLSSFPLDFEEGDGLAAGDVGGADGKAEIIHADRANWIRIYDMEGELLSSFRLDFEDGDGLTAGDVDGDGKAEIIHGDRGDVINIFFEPDDTWIEDTWPKEIFECNFAEWDGLTAGDVDGDGDAEIIHGDRDDWIHILDRDNENSTWGVKKDFSLDFEQGDRLTAGDVNKDDCDASGNCTAEIIHGDRNNYIYMFDIEGTSVDNFVASIVQQPFNNNQDIGYRNEDWMGKLNDSLRISDLSIPGTHDTMSHYGGGYVKCQTFRLDQQLKSGIRALDIRLDERNSSGCDEERLGIFHGCEFQNAYFLSNVLEVCRNFLNQHPSETILMRIKRENIPALGWLVCADEKRCSGYPTFVETLRKILFLYDRECVDSSGSLYGFGWSGNIWQFTGNSDPTTSNPTLDEVRGKIVILDSLTTEGQFGIQWSKFLIQDKSQVEYTHASMNDKWSAIKNHLNEASSGSASTFINHTSGQNVPFMNPVDVARGILIGLEYCDGMNKRTYGYLRQKLDEGELWRTGVIMMDFPGAGLIHVIIAHNGPDQILENNAPEADANGPYVSGEGSEITFDASASFDADDDALQYRWDLDDDGNWDADWSSSPTVVFTWYDDYIGVVQLEVTDGNSVSDVHSTSVTVNNVAPTTTIDSISSPVKGCILPGQEVVFVGSFTDPGCLDTHTAEWNFGDGSIVPSGTLTEENDEPDATGSVLDGHTYDEPGTFTVLLEILDDDGGIGTANIEIEVMTASEAVDFADSFIQNLPESCFKGQADNRKNAFSNKFKAVKNALGAGGDIRGAINKLINDIRAKADGSVDGKSSNDWITDEDAQEGLCLVIDELVKYLESLQNG